MKKGYGLIALAVLLTVAPAFAQNPIVGVYWDPQGTRDIALSGSTTYTAYVVAFFENVVGGAAYQIMISDPHIMLMQETIPPGILIGSCITGCEIGLTVPQYGFNRQPVLLETLTLFASNAPYTQAELSVHPWQSRYERVLLADHLGYLYAADGLSGWIWAAAGTESTTWGGVKDLYK